MNRLHLKNNQDSKQFTKNAKGFTLIEIMITIAIMGIITAAAWPSFDRYQQKGRRADGIGALLENSSRLEKCIANHGAYNNASCTTTTPSKRNYYAITAVLGEETYTLTATAQNAQADDAECVTLTLTNLGQKGSTGSAPVTRCWSQ